MFLLPLFYDSFKAKALLSHPISGPRPDEFYNLLETAYYLRFASDINAFNAFLTWIRTFRYLGFVPQLRVFLDTLSNAGSETGGFLIIFGIVLFGGSEAFMLVFGNAIFDFRNLSQSSFSLVR